MKQLVMFMILIAAGVWAQDDRIIPPYVEIAPCPLLCYTKWFDRDNPSGFGDYETLINLRAENPGQICDHPFAIQAQTLSGVDAALTGQVFAYYNTVDGFACVNSQQNSGRRCLDYRVRFVCPCPEWVVIKEKENIQETE